MCSSDLNRTPEAIGKAYADIITAITNLERVGNKAALVAVIEKGVKEAIGTLIVQFGSFGKAPLVEQASLDEMAERYKKM